jgi:hypothetical protein
MGQDLLAKARPRRGVRGDSLFRRQGELVLLRSLILHMYHIGHQVQRANGPQTYKGGNDYEIFSDSRTIGHTVTCPEDTAKLLQELFFDKA